MNLFFAVAAKLQEPFVVITFTGGKGHLPQKLGAKAIVTQKGLVHGTVGGGKVEARAIEEALSLLRAHEEKPVSVTWNLQRDLGMTCGGEMSFLLEAFFPHTWNIAVYGAGHVAQALVRVLGGLEDATIFCADPRSEWREKLAALPNLRVLENADPAQFPSGTYHVVVTQDHVTDVPILAALARVESPYVGVIGSKTKAAKLRLELAALGCPASFIEKIRCPMGLEIGGNKPGEIAISVAAQLMQEHDRENE
ncbi:MAG: XdhC family protein [Bdellovibrionota bacterium]